MSIAPGEHEHHHNLELGRLGEEAAVGYLLGSGWRILARNLRSRKGEIDILAEDRSDPDAPALVVVEVKTRSAHARFGSGVLSVGKDKCRRLVAMADQILLQPFAVDINPQLPLGRYSYCRVDVVGVTFDSSGIPVFEHYALVD